MPKLVTVARFDHPLEAHAARQELEEQGFHVFLADNTFVGMDPIVAGALGGIKLQVPESEANMAASFLDKHRQIYDVEQEKKASQPDVIFNCEECGRPLTFPGARRGGVETCPHCQRYIDVPD